MKPSLRREVGIGCALALCTLSLPSRADAEPSPPVPTLSLDEALGMADNNSLDLAQARERLAQSETGIATARAALLPTASLQGKYTFNSYAVELPVSEFSGTALQVGDALVTTTGDLYAQTGKTPSAASQQALDAYQATKAGIVGAKPIVITPVNQLDATGSVQVPLVVPSAWYQLRSARRTVDAARAGYSVSRAQTMLQVAQYFYQAAGADEVLTARLHAVAVARQTLDDASAKFEEGTASVVERDRAQISYDRAVQSAAEAGAQVEQAYRTLSTSIGATHAYHVTVAAPVVAVADASLTTSGPTNVAAAAPPDASIHAAAATPAGGDLATLALQLRPEFLQSRKQLEASRASSDANLARWLPTLSAFGQARAFNYGGFSGRDYAFAAGVQLDWVLYDGGTRDAARKLADAQAGEARAHLALLDLTIRDDVANAQRTLEVRHSNVDTSQRAVALSLRTLDRVRAQHQAGTITQLDLLTAQDNLVSSELTLAQARFDLALAELTLQRTVGTFPKARASSAK